MENKRRFEITSFALHILAMALMLCDHLWASVVPGNDWMTDLGRLAFPIFAFMIVEGYFRTKNLKKYVLRLLVCAVISEIPFNLVMGGGIFYPFHQNVLWTFLIGIGLMQLNERAKAGGRVWLRVLAALSSVVLGCILGLVTMVDYLHAGVLTVLVFYFFRSRRWWCFAAQLVALWYLNVEMLGGFSYAVELFGETHYIVRQGFAIFALIPIWLYRGRQGHHSRAFRWLCYGFYPAHLLVLGLVMRFAA